MDKSVSAPPRRRRKTLSALEKALKDSNPAVVVRCQQLEPVLIQQLLGALFMTKLTLLFARVTEENWRVLMGGLELHPALSTLILVGVMLTECNVFALAKLLKNNPRITTLHLKRSYSLPSAHEIFRSALHLREFVLTEFNEVQTLANFVVGSANLRHLTFEPDKICDLASLANALRQNTPLRVLEIFFMFPYDESLLLVNTLEDANFSLTELRYPFWARDVMTKVKRALKRNRRIQSAVRNAMHCLALIPRGTPMLAPLKVVFSNTLFRRIMWTGAYFRAWHEQGLVDAATVTEKKKKRKTKH